MNTIDRFLPTSRERTKLERIAALRTWLVLPALLVPLIVLALGRLIPDQNHALFLIVAAVALVAMLAPIVYLSMFLRCPRCSGWISPALPKCPACGLRITARAKPAA